tara:strand:+ start:1709 stop:2056 length:348 start_codon:yes stop_codon:yes gene_type:complete
MYRPLPSEVTINKSHIDGLGLFATCDIKEGHNLGITHIHNHNFENQYIRTPLGGFINHANVSNCKLIKSNIIVGDHDKDWKRETVLMLITKQLIPANTELTTYYSLYNISNEEMK